MSDIVGKYNLRTVLAIKIWIQIIVSIILTTSKMPYQPVQKNKITANVNKSKIIIKNHRNNQPQTTKYETPDKEYND